MCLLFESGQTNPFRNVAGWAAVGLSVPASWALITFQVASQYWLTYPLVVIPMLYCWKAQTRLTEQKQNTFRRLWLLKNGDQVVGETFDGLMHKLNIG